MARIDQVLAGEATWGRWALDQIAHIGLGTAYALLPVGMVVLDTSWSIPAALFLGFAAAGMGGIVREVVQTVATGKPHLLDRSLDALFHLPGGALALGIILAAQALL